MPKMRPARAWTEWFVPRLKRSAYISIAALDSPGVRFAGGDAGDQKRVATPALAKAIGSDYIVVGRPITQAENPVAAYRRCAAEFIG